VNAEQYSKVIEFGVTHCPKRAVMVIGHSGIGKSEVPEQVAKNMGIPFSVLDCTAMEPADILGAPNPEAKFTSYKPPKVLYEAAQKPKGIFVLEEITRLDQQVRHAVMPFILKKQIGDLQLPEGWMLVITANPADEGYQVNELDVAQVRRAIVIELKYDIEIWRKHGLKTEIHPRVLVAAGRLMGGLSKAIKHKIEQELTPFGLEVASDLLKADVLTHLDKETALSLLAGACGNEGAMAIIESVNDTLLNELLEKALNGEKGLKASHDVMINLVYVFWERVSKNTRKYIPQIKNLYEQLPSDVRMLLIRQCYDHMVKYPDAFKEIIEEWAEWCTKQMKSLQLLK
jgi:MoxR-like ATPase